jgi:streptogramin lyase/cytochrome c5
MRLLLAFSFGVLGSAIVAASFADAATITGTVTGPDGAPFRAAFVQARNAKTKITVSVLSDNHGRYRVDNLAAGDYRLQIVATGFRADPKSGVALAADQSLAQDFALQKSAVRWSDISLHQGQKLLPEGEGKDLLFRHCFACHGFESRIAKVARDEDGWRSRVNYMKEAMGFFIMRPQNEFTDEKAEKIVAYLTKYFGETPDLPKSPADVPGYQETVRKFSDEALKIVYVEYETPGPDRMPWAAHPDKDGKYWAAYYGRANKIARLDPDTGEMKEFPVPHLGTAAIHSAMPAPDGTVWLTQQGSNKLGKWDPKTEKITEYQDDWGKHTVRIAPDGMVWSTGGLTRFDPKTEQFTHIADVPNAYGIALDKESNVWFAELRRDGRIGKVDAKTLKVTKYQPPTATGFPRRIQVDDQGVVWFAEFQAGKIGQFDPKTERFKEFTLPGPRATPYALDLDHDRKVWYSSEWMDVVGRLDPATGEVVEFPIPRAENTMREFFMDAQGRMWFGSPANDRVGYFYLAE